jgi:predicted neuraminidase
MKKLTALALLAWTSQICFAFGEDVQPASIQLASKDPAGGVVPFQPGELLFTDRRYAVAETPELLANKNFLRTSMEGVSFKCVEPGSILVLTPDPRFTGNSASSRLLQQGFDRADHLPSFQLMLEGPANQVDVYQKTLKKDEWITIPKWGVVVGFNELSYYEGTAYLDPPRVLTNPTPEYAPSTRTFQGISSLAVAPGGRLWAVWYGGPINGENEHNFVLAATSADQGTTWSSEKLVIDPDGPGPVRAFDPQVWVDPAGKLWIFWAQTLGHDGKIAGTWAITTEEPNQENPVWSEPRRIADGIMMGKPDVFSKGEWMLPTSIWEDDNSARMVVSMDQGKTWTVRGAAHVPQENRNSDEHMIVELNDGRLWMLVRTKTGMGESFSSDRGATWTPVVPSEIKHTVSRFFIRRLASGNLLLVKHGGIGEATGRSHLRAFISQDDAKTWTGGLLLDERTEISYPDGIQGADGTIYITYDRSRGKEKEILLARFSEDDVTADKLVTPGSALRILINKATGK